jgi:hypothetical protein
MQLTRADDQIDVRRTFENPLLVLLSHTAQDADDLFGMFVFQTAESSQRAVDFVLGVLPDTARVEQNRVGLLWFVRKLVASLAQVGDDQLAVQHVHLAANRFDVQAFAHQ